MRSSTALHQIFKKKTTTTTVPCIYLSERKTNTHTHTYNKTKLLFFLYFFFFILVVFFLFSFLSATQTFLFLVKDKLSWKKIVCNSCFLKMLFKISNISGGSWALGLNSPLCDNIGHSVLRGGYLGLRPGWPPRYLASPPSLDMTSSKIKHVCQGDYSGLRPRPPLFASNLRGRRSQGRWALWHRQAGIRTFDSWWHQKTASDTSKRRYAPFLFETIIQRVLHSQKHNWQCSDQCFPLRPGLNCQDRQFRNGLKDFRFKLLVQTFP